MSAGIDEHFGRESVVFRRAAKPGAAVNEDEDRGVWLLGTLDFEFLDLAWAIRFALRRSQPQPGLIAPAGVAFGDLEAERRIDILSVCRIELNLIHVHPDMGPFRMRRGSNTAFVGECWYRG